jgi:hypothetical protein
VDEESEDEERANDEVPVDFIEIPVVCGSVFNACHEDHVDREHQSEEFRDSVNEIST